MIGVNGGGYRMSGRYGYAGSGKGNVSISRKQVLDASVTACSGFACRQEGGGKQDGLGA